MNNKFSDFINLAPGIPEALEKMKVLTPSRCKTAIVMIVSGEYAGKKAYVTRVDTDYDEIWTTPIDGDSFTSVCLKIDDVHFLEYKIHAD